MNKLLRRIGSFMLAAMLVLSLTGGSVQAAGTLPTAVTECGIGGFSPEYLGLGFEGYSDWVNAAAKLTVNGTEFSKVSSLGWGDSGTKWCAGSYTGAYGSYPGFKIIDEAITYPATIVISAEGYSDLTVKVEKSGSGYFATYTATVSASTPDPEPEPAKTYAVSIAADIQNGTIQADKTEAAEGETVTLTAAPASGYQFSAWTVTTEDGTAVAVTDNAFTMPAAKVTVSASFTATAPGTIALSQITVKQDTFGSDWYFTFEGAEGYVSKITGLSVNGTAWEETSYVSSGGKYKKDTSNDRLVLARTSYGSVPAIKSGDEITIKADGYDDLTFKVIIENGKVTITEADGQGDVYELRVKLEGSFEAAIKGQKDYDGVSSASSSASQNHNSSVTVYGALVKKGEEPKDSDWKELESWGSDINVVGSKCRVSIVPDTEKGTAASSSSGMTGVYLTISSALTLSGTPQDPGDYLISIHVEDDQGRSADSNALPFRIYTGEETLAERLVLENLTQTADGKYMWNYMEPWSISKFGSNVEGEEESVRVPAEVKAWYGSKESGTYGYIGYDMDYAEVEAGNIPQTLYIPAGCDLTLVNMEVLNSVRIVVEKGGHLTLRDSVVYGIIDVEDGGTFSMNYDSYNDTFELGASVCGQIRLQDGAILENATIHSNANYLANGTSGGRNTTDPVVVATGNVTVRGIVAIQGDSGASESGQTALLVKDGTVTVGKDSSLTAIGGDGKVIGHLTGGTGIVLDNGNITGEGQLNAIGGEVLFGKGGSAITGNGSISTDKAFVHGATAYGKSEPGKALAGNDISLTSPSRSVEDGTQIGQTENDPQAELYWKPAIEKLPPLEKYVTSPVEQFTVTAAASEKGTLTVSAEKAAKGDLIRVTAEPKEGYKLSRVYYTYEGVGEIEITSVMHFRMPAAAVTVTAEYTADSTDPTKPADPTKPTDPTKPEDPAKPTDTTKPTVQPSSKGGSHKSANAASKAVQTTAARTADTASPARWMTLALLAAAVPVGILSFRRKKNG